ncbi:MAG: HAD family hydrolase [Chloroflexota bacterium]
MVSSNSHIQALLFDFVGVLLLQRNDYVPDEMVDAVDALAGQVVDDHQFTETVLNDYRLPEPMFYYILTKIVDKYTPFHPLWNLLPELRRRYKLAIINNGTSLTLPLFNAKFGINDKFDAFVSSAVEGTRKPDTQIYLRACERLRVPPERCLFA